MLSWAQHPHVRRGGEGQVHAGLLGVTGSMPAAACNAGCARRPVGPDFLYVTAQASDTRPASCSATAAGAPLKSVLLPQQQPGPHMGPGAVTCAHSCQCRHARMVALVQQGSITPCAARAAGWQHACSSRSAAPAISASTNPAALGWRADTPALRVLWLTGLRAALARP